MKLREGDIESIRNKMRDMGKPIKSNAIVKGDDRIDYKVDKKGRVTIINK